MQETSDENEVTICPNPSLPPSPYLPSKTTRSGRKLRSLNPTSFVVFFCAAWKFHTVLGARQQEIPEHNIIQNNHSASVILIQFSSMQKKLFCKENNQVPPGSPTMNECYYIHCCHDQPGFDSCKECNHTIEHKLLVWTRSTVYCIQRVFHLTSKHFEVVLQCDYCNRAAQTKLITPITGKKIHSKKAGCGQISSS